MKHIKYYKENYEEEFYLSLKEKMKEIQEIFEDEYNIRDTKEYMRSQDDSKIYIQWKIGDNWDFDNILSYVDDKGQKNPLYIGFILYYDKNKDISDLMEDIDNLFIPKIKSLGYTIAYKKYKYNTPRQLCKINFSIYTR